MFKKILLVISIIALCVGSVNAQKVGDRIVVTANFDTKIRSQKVGKVYGGSINNITYIQGKWCMLEGVRGWCPLQYTMNLGTARKVYERRIRANKNDYDALATLGMIEFEQGNSNKALDLLTGALRVNNRIASIWNNRGIVFSSVGRFDDAYRDINVAIKLNKNYSGAYGNRGLVNVAAGKFEEAIKDFTKAIELSPNNPTHYKNRGATYQSVGKFDQAMSDFNRSIQIDARFTKAYIGLANVYLAQEKLTKAFDNAREAVRLNPKSALALNNLGWIKYRRGMLDEAIDDFTRAINHDSKLTIAYSNRGIVKIEKQHFDAAIRDFNTALKLTPRSAVTLNNRANAWIGKKDYARAKQDFESALKNAPDLSDAVNGFAWFLATCPDEKYRDGKKALELTNKLLKMEKETATANMIDTHAAALAETGDFEAAVETQKKAIKKAGNKNKTAYQNRLESYENKKPFRSKAGKPQQRRSSR